MADLDHFKELNDTHGHEAGDRALRAVRSQCCRRDLRPDDIASRYGGEEFVLLLPDTDVTEALKRARAAAGQAGRPHRAHRRCLHFTVSWGLTDSASGTTFEEILAAADAVMYTAKRSGKDCIVIDGETARRDGCPTRSAAARSSSSGTGRRDPRRRGPRRARSRSAAG